MENTASTANGKGLKAGQGHPLPQQLASIVMEVLLTAVREERDSKGK